MDFQNKNKIKLFWSILLVVLAISGLTIGMSYSKLFQSLEWLAFDTWFRLRPQENKETRLTIITINESDIRELGQWPMSDLSLSQLITQINQQQPKAIGLDIYRDLPIPPGTTELIKVFRSTANLIGVEKVIGEPVKPSPILQKQQQVGLADLVRDEDGKIRRGLLSVELDNGEVQLGLAPKLALMYLATEEIYPEPIGNTGILALGKGEIIPFQGNDGGYVNADDGGFQVLINYRGIESSFNQISLTDVLNGNIPKDLFRDRIVLIGVIAPSLNDFFATPYSQSRIDQNQDLPGVFIHANIVSQILSGALDGRDSIQTVKDFWEWVWIFSWTFSVLLINIVLLELRSHSKSTLVVIFSRVLILLIPGFAIMGTGYLLFLNSFWLPVISPLFSSTLLTIITHGYYKQNQEKYQEKLALTDSLTKIPNRRCFDEFLQENCLEAQKKEQSLSIILCDVDFFKKYNDTYGHQAGDLCLQKVATVLAQSVRNSDLAARYGGEEFVVVLPDTPPESAMIIAQRICDRLKSLEIPHISSQASEYVTLSCGVASTLNSSANSPEELIAKADRALYQAKEQGRDRAILWDKS